MKTLLSVSYLAGSCYSEIISKIVLKLAVFLSDVSFNNTQGKSNLSLIKL